jgi:3-isopropylmalate dehydrogenase
MKFDRSTRRIVVLPGDHVGIEVTRAAEQVLRLIDSLSPFNFEIVHGKIGGAAIDEFGKLRNYLIKLVTITETFR